MATQYAGNSGYILKSGTGGWASVRDATSGSAYDNPTSGRNSIGIYAQHASGRGGSAYSLYRSFFYFDTSGITNTLSSATLKIYGYGFGTADVIAVKSDAFGGDGGTALANADFNNFDTSTTYSSELATWSTSGYNDITLNATALADIKNNNAFILCLMEHDYDYSDSAPSGAMVRSGVYYDNYTGTSRDPYIDYTLATGYGNTVNGVAAADISKVNGVATADISKVNGT
mgnify:CR=1 FL=1|tara:strand:+ start:1922 stop:2611 length:690 start_codon:yes stop_codon:yes gene_type:complete